MTMKIRDAVNEIMLIFAKQQHHTQKVYTRYLRLIAFFISIETLLSFFFIIAMVMRWSIATAFATTSPGVMSGKQHQYSM